LGCDASQSLADCLNSALSDEPLQVAPYLTAQEVDPLGRLEGFWTSLEPLLGATFSREVLGTATEELILAPGMADVVRLLALKQACDSGAYDVIVVDLGSSLTALQLLSYPEGTAWWVDRLLGTSPGEDNPLLPLVDLLAENLAGLRTQLGDADEASVRLVTTGELLALRETQRSLTFVNLYGYNVDALILNRQKNIPRSVADTFAAWPILCLTLYDRDIIGRNLLSEMALALFPPPAEPDAVLMAGQVQRLTKASNGYVLSLRLPFVHEDDIDVLQHHGQLILQIGSMRRVLRLPSPVDQLNAADAVLEEGTLEVHFR
ncbi:MAG: ArsA family ATPase, partial [Chloroflexi bacterium]|nr:ArsA family ATPase [Chloroflexota bacterium]